MQERTILIANNKTQKRYEIKSSATTLGELQDQMTSMGIDYTGMSFTEGLSKTELLSRDSLLPTNVMYKGAPTNDLIMLLTNTTKQISSGAMDRKEAYRLIKEMNLQGTVLDGEGVNYTRVKTDVLEGYIYANGGGVAPSEETPQKSEFKLPDIKTAPHPEAVEWYYMGLKALLKSGFIYTDDVAVIADLATELYKRLKEEQPKISYKDVDDILASL